MLIYLPIAELSVNTFVVFLSDNGGCQENVQPGWYDIPDRTRDGRPIHVGNDPKLMPGPETVFQSYGPAWANASNMPFRRFKHFTEEGGISTPFIVRWPGHARRGVSNALISHVDLLASLADLSGQPLEPDAGPDSSKMMPALLGPPPTPRP